MCLLLLTLCIVTCLNVDNINGHLYIISYIFCGIRFYLTDLNTICTANMYTDKQSVGSAVLIYVSMHTIGSTAWLFLIGYLTLLAYLTNVLYMCIISTMPLSGILLTKYRYLIHMYVQICVYQIMFLQ